MSSRKRKAAIRTTREEIRAGRTPTEDTASGEGERLAAAVDRRRREVAHAQEQTQLRAVRRSPAGRVPMDRFDTASTEARWDYAVMHVAHQVDEGGAPLLRDAFAAWCDDQRGARFVGAWRDLLKDKPGATVAAALHRVLQAGADEELELFTREGAREAEERAAAALGLSVHAVRRRAGIAVRLLLDACQGDVPGAIGEYASVRGARWARYSGLLRPA